MMFGPCRGGAVRLAPPGDVLMVGEGIEQPRRHAGDRSSRVGGTVDFWTPELGLPEDVRDVIVLADGDAAGEAAARDCGGRWKREGRRVRIARPPRGMDFNDLLIAGVARIEEGG